MQTAPKDINVLAIRSDFIHHGEHSGYKQILKYTDPAFVIGVNERAEKPQSAFMNGYCWPYEFAGLKYRKDINLIHHLYADEFFRFSARLYNVPIVGTFHQTPELLEHPWRSAWKNCEINAQDQQKPLSITISSDCHKS